VSTYKHKQELRSELERKAGLKFIAERRAAVRAREAVAKDAEEKVAIAQGHVDECEAKLAKLRAEADELHAQDHFGNREKVKALQARAGPLSDKLREAQAELAREAEIEYRCAVYCALLVQKHKYRRAYLPLPLRARFTVLYWCFTGTKSQKLTRLSPTAGRG
jgi:predicted mannosyl-3-phosphoglycerate phosphatase (HAD superfamily)